MTGFGSATRADKSFEVRVEVRAVNHRGLSIRCNVPGDLSGLESRIEARIRARLARGTVSLQLRFQSMSPKRALEIDEPVLAAYAEQLGELAAQLGFERPDLAYLMNLPGVQRAGETTAPDPALVLASVEDALDAMLEMRAGEGAKLAAEIRSILQDLDVRAKRIEARWPDVVQAYADRIEKRVVDFLEQRGQTLADVDLVREVAIWADKADVAEELARFRAHLEEVTRMLDAGGVLGRRLEFLGQELLREANTMSAKSSDIELARDIVEIKSGLDRIREQGQNLE